MLSRAGEVKDRALAQIIDYWRTPLYRNAHALMINTVAVSGLGILYWLLAARVYPDRDVGVNSTMIATMMFLSGLAQLNMVSALYRFMPQAGGGVPRFVRSVYVLNTVMAVAVVAAFAVISQLILTGGNFLNGNLPLIGWFGATVILYGIFALQDGVMIGLRQAIWLPLENTTFGVLKIGLLLVFAIALPTFGIFASWSVAMAILLIPVNLLIFRRLIPQHVTAHPLDAPQAEITLRTIRRFISLDYMGALFYMCSTNLLPLLVANQLGSKDAAYFYIAWLIGSALDVFGENMATSLTVEGAADPAQLMAYGRKRVIHIYQLLIPAVAVLLVVAPLVLAAFGSDYAAGAGGLLRLLGLATLPRAINYLFLGVSRVQNRLRNVVFIQAASALLILTLGFILSARFGIIGIGIASLVSESLVANVIIMFQWLSIRSYSRKIAEI